MTMLRRKDERPADLYEKRPGGEGALEVPGMVLFK